jgi:sugar phosphate isomerase/epimerase
MNSMTRREAGKLLLAGVTGLVVGGQELSGATTVNSKIRGVQIGVQGWSFRDMSLADAIQACRSTGLGECELTDVNLASPSVGDWDARTKWVRSKPVTDFKDVRPQFDKAGVNLYAFTYGFRKGMTDEDIDFGFQLAKLLGVRYITSSSNVSMAPRVDPFAQKYKITVGFHGHDDTANPDEFSTEETFDRALRGASQYLAVNLDIGHFTAAGGDAVDYIRRHHDRIVTLHIKDRKKNHGENVPFGEGDTPIADVLRLLRDNRWTIPANIEYEYGKPGMNTIAEVRKSFDFCRKALES